MSQRTVNFRRGEQLVERVNLADITTSHNPRRPERALQEALADEGYEGWTLLDLGLCACPPADRPVVSGCR